MLYVCAVVSAVGFLWTAVLTRDTRGLDVATMDAGGGEKARWAAAADAQASKKRWGEQEDESTESLLNSMG